MLVTTSQSSPRPCRAQPFGVIADIPRNPLHVTRLCRQSPLLPRQRQRDRNNNKSLSKCQRQGRWPSRPLSPRYSRGVLLRESVLLPSSVLRSSLHIRYTSTSLPLPRGPHPHPDRSCWHVLAGCYDEMEGHSCMNDEKLTPAMCFTNSSCSRSSPPSCPLRPTLGVCGISLMVSSSLRPLLHSGRLPFVL